MANVRAVRRGELPSPERLHGQTAVALWEATRRHRVGFLSELSRKDPDAVRDLGWIPLRDPAEASRWAAQGGGRWGYLREADTVLPRAVDAGDGPA